MGFGGFERDRGGEMTCTASPLAGLGLRDGHDLQALSSSLAAVGSCLDKTRVHHIPHPRYRHRSLSYVGGQYDLHSSYIGGQDDLHSSAILMPLLLVMAHRREWQRGINHTVQRLKADLESSSVKSDLLNIIQRKQCVAPS